VEPGRRRSEGKDFSVVKSPAVMKKGPNAAQNDEPVLFGSSGNNNQENEAPDACGKQHEDDERTRKITSLSEQFRTYSDALAMQNLSVVSVEGDGNCLFRAVAHQVYGNESYHMVVRAKCLDYMEVEADFFSQFVEGGKEFFPLYLRAKRMDACWGDDPEIEVRC
jgi:OTU domain-containing protein 5